MRFRRRLKLFFYLNVLIVVLLATYKIYLNFIEGDFEAVHSEQVERIQSLLADRETFSFAVVGNINNSVGIFERKIIPRLNAADVDFVVSAGNAVGGGGEDRYRALYRSLENLRIPYLLTFGEKEAGNFASPRYYKHFGPYFFAFSAGNARFVFLDSTGETPLEWQLRWLKEELSEHSERHAFLFISHPLRETSQETLLASKSDYLRSRHRQELLDTIERFDVDAVFSSNLPLYSRQRHGGTEYIITGGAGGLVLNNETSFYHYVKVTVEGEKMAIGMERLDIGQHQVLMTLESLWFFIHSLFYTGWVNFVLILSVFVALTIKLYTLVFTNRDYYPDYNLDPAPYLERPLRVAMFTNNYLPFVGGVPISIERLRRGLAALGHAVTVIAPRYPDTPADEEGVLRLRTLVSMGTKREFKLANFLTPAIWRHISAFRPDIVHLHHPFWLGSAGLWLARRRKVPAVYTYHTRFEHYAHYVPVPGLLVRNLISHFLIKRFCNKCDGVIVPTYTAEEYLRLIGVKTSIFVQPTGIDYRRFADVDAGRTKALRRQIGIGEDERVLISVSRISREKNIDFLVDAIKLLHERAATPFRFLMIGDGNERDRVQRRIDELGLSETFLLIGEVAPDEVAAYYHLGDVFLFASESETQGMVILEAMAAALPVVAVRSSGIDDVVRDDYNGFKTTKNPHRWCDKALLLMEDDSLRGRLSSNARAFARDYDIEPFARQVNLFYARVLAAREQSERGVRIVN